MLKKYKEIEFRNRTVFGSDFDIVRLEDLLNKSPKDHSQFEFHKVSFFIVLLIQEGEGNYNLNFEDYQFKKGSLFTIRKGYLHKFNKTEAKGTLLLFTKKFFSNFSSSNNSKAMMLFNDLLSTPHTELKNEEYDEINSLVKLAKSEYLSKTDEQTAAILKNIIQAIFFKLYRIKSGGNALFNNHKQIQTFLKFQQKVEKECFNSRKVSYYSQLLNVSTKSLNQASQLAVLKTAKQLITGIFLTQVKRIIVNSSESLTMISFMVGFDEPTNFFKYFYKQTGMSPREFRESSYK